MPFCLLQNNENDKWACSEQTVTHTAIWHSLRESLFCMDYNPFCFKSIQVVIQKLMPLLYIHEKST